MSSHKKPFHQTAAAFAAGSDPLAVAPPAVTTLAAALASFSPEPPAYDPATAEALVIAYRPRLDAIVADRLDVPRVDVDAVCMALLGVYALTQFEPVLAIYKSAANDGRFDLANLERLRDVTLVFLHSFRLADSAGVFRKARISAKLDTKSAEVEARVQRVCEHYFENDAQIGPILRRLSPGTSYLDRAYDLFGYADIYEAKHTIVSKDPVHYVATDMDEARKLAGDILGELGAAMTPQAREAFERMKRAWTLLKALYFEVQEVGRAGLRYDPRRDERFPSLFSVGRKHQGRPRQSKAKDGGTTPPPTGAPSA